MEHPTAVSFEMLLSFALREQARREMAELPGREALARLYPDTSGLDRRVLAKARRPRRFRLSARMLRALAVIAAVFVLVAATALTTAAQVRRGSKNFQIKWGDDGFMTFRFDLEGEPLDALPEGYGPHYIPEGYVLEEELCTRNFFDSYDQYRCGDQVIIVELSLLENSFQVDMDNEHTAYNLISFQGETGLLGHWIPHKSTASPESYTLIWAHDGIVHTLYSETDLTELMRIAESIY